VSSANSLAPALRASAAKAADATRARVLARRRCGEIATQICSELSPIQLAFKRDPSPTAAALTSRQAGKTFTCAHDLLDTALTVPNSLSVYINTTEDECERVIWRNPDSGVGLLQTIERLKIPCRTNETKHLIHVPAMNSFIQLIGVDDEPSIGKIRGPTYDKIYVDESQKIGYLKELVEGSAEAAMIKRHGVIRLIGTPGSSCDGFFFDITRADGGAIKGWSVHRWTILDNPGIPHAAQYLQDLLKRKGWTEDNEIFRREYKGEWVADSSLLVYRLAKRGKLGYYDALPAGNYDWRNVVGIDLGYYPDPFAYVVWTYCEDIPVLFERESAEHEALNTEDQAYIIKRVNEQYRPERMVGDAGSGGLKQIVVGDWQGRYHLPVDMAQKEDKDAAIEMFNTDIDKGRVKFLEKSILSQQMLILPWKKKIGAKRIEDVRRNGGKFLNHACDGGLYGYRETPFYLGQPREEMPPPGSLAAASRELDERKEALLRRYDSDEPTSIYDAMDSGGWKEWR
jgi:hypothetical protein